MKRKLTMKETIVVASTLFGMFFGAGNLIFPVHLGQMAGSNSWPAILGFCITAVTIPILAVAAIGNTHSDNLLELTAKGATKGGMVLRLAEMLGVAREDIYCIGDHGNDISMAQVSALRFAPANAIEEMKALPGMRIVSHCAEGAVADVIEELDRRY